VELNWDSTLAEKKGYSHFMLKEIYEQPQSVSAAMAPHIQHEPLSVHLHQVGFGSALSELGKIDAKVDAQNTSKVFQSIDRVQVVACGTSFYAGQVGKYLIEKMARVPVEIDIASEFRYREPIIDSKTLFICISQSGETADTLAAIRLAKEKGAKTLSICNVRNSTIDREAHGHLYLNAGVEIGVASTKAFTATLTVLNLLSLAIARAKDRITEAQEKDFLHALLIVPSQMEGMLAYDKYFTDAAAALKEFKGFLYMGRGVSYPIAMEGALKMKELAYLHAEGYAAGEMKHGPLALIDQSMAIVMIVPDDDLFEKSVSNLEEAKARGGKIISIGTGQSARLKSVSDRYLALPESIWTTHPMLSVVPLQLMAFHLAQSLGHDVDQPRNLAKSVTVE
jgi:glucosamine--fructose-6-phosphate aminotransferase (isomerizing)